MYLLALSGYLTVYNCNINYSATKTLRLKSNLDR